MNPYRPAIAAIVAILMLGPVAQGQRERLRNSSAVNNIPPNTEFILARWHYTAGWRGDGWGHDYPVAEEHILQIMTETTGIETSRLAYRVVELSSPEIFKYPFAYVSEPGEMRLSDQEIEQLRQYIDRGGFVMIDDFGGQRYPSQTRPARLHDRRPTRDRSRSTPAAQRRHVPTYCVGRTVERSRPCDDPFWRHARVGKNLRSNNWR